MKEEEVERGDRTKTQTFIFDADSSTTSHILTMAVPRGPVRYQVMTYHPACDPEKLPSPPSAAEETIPAPAPPSEDKDKKEVSQG